MSPLLSGRFTVSKLFLRQACVRLGALIVLLGMAVSTAWARDVTDALGRVVKVPDTVQRVVLGEGRLISAFALLDRDRPFQRIVGWQNDLRKLDPNTYAAYVAKFPQVKDIPLIGQASEQSVSAEQILALKPDLAVFSISGHGPTEHSPVADVLEKAGIAVLFVDFRVNPLQGTRDSMTALGQALGREAQASAFVDFYNRHVERITRTLGTLDDSQRPGVFLELLVGVWANPGHTTGKGGMGELIRLVGGRNIAEGVVPGALGDISVEYALKADPDVYILSGNQQPGVMLGAGIDAQTARTSLMQVLKRPQFAELRAVREGTVHALWHDFYNSPYNILAIEALAKWVHPQKFTDLDPQLTLNELNQEFLDTPLAGQYWISEQQ